MKSKKMIDAWHTVKPDDVEDKRMLAAILTYNREVQSKKEREKSMKWAVSRKHLLPITACFLIVTLVLVGIIGNSAGWFQVKNPVTDVEGGTLTFYKGNTGEAKVAWDVDWGDCISRELAPEEIKTLFGELAVSGHAWFRSTDKALMHFEGKAGDVMIALASNGHPVTDVIISGNEEASEVNGVPVKAGYFITDANSKGIKTIIYFADFEVEGTKVYVTLGGEESRSESLRSEISDIICQLTKNPPDSSAVTAE